MDFTGGALGAVGGIAQGVLGFIGQQDTNSANAALQQQAEQYNTGQVAQQEAYQTGSVNAQEAYQTQSIANQEAYQTQMSNTAYQRSVADMTAAGLNPILGVSSGGASSPSGSSSSGSSASGASASAPMTTMQNSGKYLGDAAGSLVSSAVDTMKNLKSLDSMDADIAAKKAGALSSLASANNQNASAKATSASMPSVEAKARSAGPVADADISAAAYRKASSDIDTKMAPIDAVTKRVYDAIGAASSAVGVGRGVQSIRNAGRQENRDEDQHLRDMGSLGSSNQ